MLFTSWLRNWNTRSRPVRRRRFNKCCCTVSSIEVLEPRLLLSHKMGHEPPGQGGGGGGGGEEPFTNPAFVYELHGKGAVDLYITTADGSVTKQLTKSRKDDDLYPTWSPDGTKISFRRDNDLYTINSDGTGLTQIYDFSTHGVLPGLRRDWSPDGSTIVFDDQAQSPMPYEDIYFFDVVNGNLQSLKGDLGAMGLPNLLDDPVFSPDLDSVTAGYQGRLAFSGFSSGITDERDLGLLEITISTSGVIQTGDVTMFTMPGTQTVPSWSPDGQFLTYTDEGQIQIIRLNGTQIEEIRTLVPQDVGITRWDSRASWSPDGQWIGFVKSFDVFRIRPDGTAMTSVITSGNRNEASIDWNPAWMNDIDTTSTSSSSLTAASISLSVATTLQAVSGGSGEGSSMFVLGSSQPSSENDASLPIDPTLISASEETSGSALSSNASSDGSLDDPLGADEDQAPDTTDGATIDELFADFGGSVLDDLLSV